MTDDLKARVLQHLPRGKQNSITGKNLAYHMTTDWYAPELNNRAIRLCIQDLIADGYPICSSPGRKADKKTNTPKQEAGYFMADSMEEVLESLVVIKSYGKKLFIHYNNLKKAARKQFGSESLLAGQLTFKL